MKKVKAKNEYDKDILDKGHSKRERRDETGFTLLDAAPDWAIIDNQWGIEYQYKRQIEGWERLCIEAYFSGWVDFFDTVIYAGKIDHTIYFEWIDDIKRQASLKIYFKPGLIEDEKREFGPVPKPIPIPPPVNLFLTLPKPPPPPMS